MAGNPPPLTVCKRAATLAARFSLAAILALTLGLADPPRVQAQEATPALPERDEVARLLWSTLIAVDQANKTGNYTVLRDLGAPGFREANDAAKLALIFQSTRDAGLNLGTTILREPEFTDGPRLTETGQLYLAGRFPARPVTTAFEMLFELHGGEWRLFGISIRPETETPPTEAEPATGTSQP